MRGKVGSANKSVKALILIDDRGEERGALQGIVDEHVPLKRTTSNQQGLEFHAVPTEVAGERVLEKKLGIAVAPVAISRFLWPSSAHASPSKGFQAEKVPGLAAGTVPRRKERVWRAFSWRRLLRTCFLAFLFVLLLSLCTMFISFETDFCPPDWRNAPIMEAIHTSIYQPFKATMLSLVDQDTGPPPALKKHTRVNKH